jgi:hypothetical protein
MPARMFKRLLELQKKTRETSSIEQAKGIRENPVLSCIVFLEETPFPAQD